MANDKKKKVDTPEYPMHRWVTTRKTKKYIIIKYPKFFTNNTKVITSGFTVQLLPWVKTAQVCLANRSIDIPVDRLETASKLDITFDADITYKVAGEAFFEDYWKQHKAEMIDMYSTNDLLLETEKERSQLISEIDALVAELERVLETLKSDSTKTLTDEEKARYSSLVKNLYSRIQTSFEIKNRKYNDMCAALGLVVADPTAYANLTFGADQYKNIKDMLSRASSLLSHPIKSKGKSAHRAPVKEFFALGAVKFKAKKAWALNHPALIYKLENTPDSIEKIVTTVVKDCLAKYCSRTEEKDIRTNFITNDEIFMSDVNNALAKYGITIVDVKLKKIDQADKELSEAYSKQLIAEQEAKAKETQAKGEAAKIKINVDALRNSGLTDDQIAQVIQLQTASNSQVIAIPGLTEVANVLGQHFAQNQAAPVQQPVAVAEEPVNVPTEEPANDFMEVPEPVQTPVDEPTPVEPEPTPVEPEPTPVEPEPTPVEPEPIQADPDLPTPVQFASVDENANIQPAPAAEPVQVPAEPVSVEEVAENEELSVKEKLFYAKLELQARQQRKLFDDAYAEYQQLVSNGTIEEASAKLEELDQIHEELEEINKQLIK